MPMPHDSDSTGNAFMAADSIMSSIAHGDATSKYGSSMYTWKETVLPGEHEPACLQIQRHKIPSHSH